ncbi:MAG TPA: phospholipase D-like domain-containing protein, partial [Steroidobacteraceae bacterium]
MSLTLKVYDNGDHTCLVWMPMDGKAISGCLGFAIRRLLNGEDSYLHGFVGFSDTDKLDPKNPWKFPVQRFLWWDYGVKPGDRVQYSIVPVMGRSATQLSLDTTNASPQTPVLQVSGQASAHLSVFFNRGIIATQWVARELQASKGSKIKNLVATVGNPLRNQLAGLLRLQVLQLMADTLKAGGQIYAALYELNDPELIAALTALGQKCHLILGNGAFKGNTSPANDENHAVRLQMRGKIDLHDRIVTDGHFAHNKFVIFCDAQGTPQRVLTGSTNWTSSGLCTQANNGLVINDAPVAADFLAAWNRLQAAG